MAEKYTQDRWNLLESANELTEIAARLFDLPGESQLANNLVSMANFLPLIKDIIVKIMPKHVVEIGSDIGFTSKHLIKLTEKIGARLTIVDPKPVNDISTSKLQHVTFRQETSRKYLSRKEAAQIYFLDGDHNYETVIMELQAISGMHESDQPTCVFVHDVGWPCGRRDMYYNLDEVIPHEHVSSARVFPTSAGVSANGYHIDMPIAAIEGGSRNGILTAIEDFLANNADWDYFSIPSIFGLGILWPPQSLDQSQSDSIEKLHKALLTVKPFLSILELNRIVLLAKIDQMASQNIEYLQAIHNVTRDKELADKEIQKLLGELEAEKKNIFGLREKAKRLGIIL